MSRYPPGPAGLGFVQGGNGRAPEDDIIRRLADLARHVLLVTENRSGDWTDWLDRARPQQTAEQQRRVFDHFFVALQAVVDGLWLGIGPLPVLQADLTAGRLLAPLPEITVPRKGQDALVPARMRWYHSTRTRSHR